MKFNVSVDRWNKDKKGRSPVYVWISFGAKRYKAFTGERIAWEDWDNDSKRAIIKKDDPQRTAKDLLNDLLDSYEAEADELRRSAKIQRIEITEEYMRERLSFFKQSSDNFYDVLDKFIQRESTVKSWAPGSVRRWNILKRKLQEFDKYKKLRFEHIDNALIEKFINWSLERKHQNSFITKNIKMILQFMRWAARNHHHSSSKYTEVDFNLKQVGQDDNIVFLTVDEVVRMHNLKFRPDQVQLEQARDCYLFQCFSGLRYSDLARVKRNNINNDFLTLISQKTGSKTKIPLHRVALSILHKYEHLPDVSPLPVVSQVKYNQHLKTLGFMAKLNDPVTVVGYSGNKRNETTVKKWEILSTHTARKTFISLAIFLGMTVEEVASITGHKSDSIKRYYTIQDQQKRESIKRLDSIKLKVV